MRLTPHYAHTVGASQTALTPSFIASGFGGSANKKTLLTHLSVRNLHGSAATITIADTPPGGTATTVLTVYVAATTGVQTLDLTPGIPVQGEVTFTSSASVTVSGNLELTAFFDQSTDLVNDITDPYPPINQIPPAQAVSVACATAGVESVLATPGAAAPNARLLVKGVSVYSLNAATFAIGYNSTTAAPPTSIAASGSTTLGAALSDTTGTTITVASTTGMVANKTVLTVDTEKILVGAIASATSVTGAVRGYAGSTAATHLNNAAVTFLVPATPLMFLTTAAPSTQPSMVTLFGRGVYLPAGFDLTVTPTSSNAGTRATGLYSLPLGVQ